MEITLTRDGQAEAATLARAEDDFVVVESACACGCQSVRGLGKSIESRDTYRADAVCCRCGAARGVLRVRVSTLFGLEEDEAVLNGRCRVY